MDELQASLALYEEKYIRLCRAHEKIQKLNQNLEEKLLNLAENHHEETLHFSGQVDDLTQSLVDARVYIHQLEDENDRYRNDINAVVQLLQCKPSSFVSPKIGMLPEDLQRKILGQKNGTGSGRKEKKIIKVQVPSTLPQMDIMYAVDNGRVRRSGENDVVSAAIIATVLQEREKERNEIQSGRCHCGPRNIRLPTHSVQTQTMPSCTISYSGSDFISPENNIPFNQSEKAKDTSFSEEHYHDKLVRQSSTLSTASETKYSTTIAPTSHTSISNLQLLSNLSSSSSPTNNIPPQLKSESSRTPRPNSLKLSQTHSQSQPLPSKSSTPKSADMNTRDYNNSVDTHWSTTVLVQHPPKRLESSLPKTTTTGSTRSGKSTSFGVGGGPEGYKSVCTSVNTSTNSSPMYTEMDSDDNESQSHQSLSSVTYKFHPSLLQHPPPAQSRQQQYYRAQKRSFWTRSSSTTSTETEI